MGLLKPISLIHYLAKLQPIPDFLEGIEPSVFAIVTVNSGPKTRPYFTWLLRSIQKQEIAEPRR